MTENKPQIVNQEPQPSEPVPVEQPQEAAKEPVVLSGTPEEIDQKLDEAAQAQKLDFDDVKEGAKDTLDKVTNSKAVQVTSQSLKTGGAAFLQILKDPMKPVSLNLPQTLVLIIISVLSESFLFYMLMQSLGKSISQSFDLFFTATASPSLLWTFLSGVLMTAGMAVIFLITYFLGHLGQKKPQSAIVVQGLVVPSVCAILAGILLLVNGLLGLAVAFVGVISVLISMTVNLSTANHYLKLLVVSLLTLALLYGFFYLLSQTLLDTSLILNMEGSSPMEFKFSDLMDTNNILDLLQLYQ